MAAALLGAAYERLDPELAMHVRGGLLEDTELRPMGLWAVADSGFVATVVSQVGAGCAAVGSTRRT